MLLGDLLAAARRSAGGFERWLRAEDPELADRFVAAAAADRRSLAGWLRMAMADFDHHASEEDWATLVSHMRDDADPGRTCLLGMLEWGLAAAGAPAPSRPATDQE